MDEGRKERARRLLGESWRVVREDRRLWVYPAVSAFVSLVLGGASFFVSLKVTGDGHFRRTFLVAGLIVSYPATFATLFSGVALAAALRARLAGEDIAAGYGWRCARARVGTIAGWTLVMCTVGAAFRVLEQYVPLGGKIAAAVLDVAWTLAALFVVPVLAYEDLGPWASLRRAIEILRTRWPELAIGGLAIGIGAGFVTVPIIFLLVIGVTAHGTAGAICLVVAGAALLAVTAVTTALDQIYRVFLYRHALGLSTTGSPFSAADLERPFSRRDKRRWFGS